MKSTPNRFQCLECITCQSRYPIHTHSLCPRCKGVLTGKYDLHEYRLPTEPNDDAGVVRSIWRFRGLFPPIVSGNIVSLGEGSTPLVEIPKYGAKVGLQHLWVKLEGQNPTGSFKDRAASIGLSLAKEWHKEGVFTASSGNAAAAIAAYSARASLPCLILIREDATATKLGQITMYGPTLLRVRNLFKSKTALEHALELTQSELPQYLQHFVWAPYNPLLIDGLKTISHEILEAATTSEGGERHELALPDYVFVPTAGGDLLFSVFKGFRELKEAGLISNIPKMVCVQGVSAAPTVRALQAKMGTVPELEAKPETVAGALRVNFGGDHALLAVRQSGGFGVELSDADIIHAQRELAKTEGIFCELSSAAALGAVAKALSEGKIGREERVLVLLTGYGFKDYLPELSSSVPLAEDPELIPAALKKLRS